MSNLKRSRSDHQDAILKRLQEISTSKLISGKIDDTLPGSLKSEKVCDDGRELCCNDTETCIAVTKRGSMRKEHVSRETTSEQHSNLSNVAQATIPIPDLMVTPENDVFTSNPASIASSATSSPKLPFKSQQLTKGLYALSVSDASDCPSSSPRTRVLPSFYSPKLGRRFESLPDYKSASSSPTSPSRKFFRLMSSPTSFAGGIRRGSEPLLDGKNLSEVQLSMTDRRWEKLRSILVAMKNEPFDADSALGLTTPDLMNNLKDNIDTQEELNSLRKELSALYLELELRDSKLNQALNDRNVALAYIKNMKLSDKDFEDENKNKLTGIDKTVMGMESVLTDGLKQGQDAMRCSIYADKIESLKKEEAEKADVLNTLTQVVEELRVERSYLNHLMSVVLDRAPWMLDEVDKGSHWVDDTPRSSDDDDDEVWC